MGDVSTPFLALHQCGHFRRTPGWRTVRDSPADHLLVWVLEGDLAVESGDRAVLARPGDLVVLRPGIPHAYAPVGGWRWLWAHFGGAAAPELADRIARGEPRVPFGFDDRVQARFLELVTAAGGDWRRGARAGPGATLRVDSCLFSLLGLMIERIERGGVTGGAPDRAGTLDLTAVCAHIDEHLEEPLTLDGLARRAGMSPSHLRRLFRREFGVSPMRYVTELRVGRAATLLSTSTLPVGAVGRAVGYADPFHFSRRFKQLTGRAPAVYRAASRR